MIAKLESLDTVQLKKRQPKLPFFIANELSMC